MNIQLAKLKRIAIFLAAISTASIPAMAHADWSIMGLGILGSGYDIGPVESYAYDINDSGQVVGTTTAPRGETLVFITGPNGIGMTDLGHLATGTWGYSAAYGINNSGRVVGISPRDFAGDKSEGFITGPNGVGMTVAAGIPSIQPLL